MSAPTDEVLSAFVKKFGELVEKSLAEPPEEWPWKDLRQAYRAIRSAWERREKGEAGFAWARVREVQTKWRTYCPLARSDRFFAALAAYRSRECERYRTSTKGREAQASYDASRRKNPERRAQIRKIQRASYARQKRSREAVQL